MFTKRNFQSTDCLLYTSSHNVTYTYCYFSFFVTYLCTDFVYSGHSLAIVLWIPLSTHTQHVAIFSLLWTCFVNFIALNFALIWQKLYLQSCDHYYNCIQCRHTWLSPTGSSHRIWCLFCRVLGRWLFTIIKASNVVSVYFIIIQIIIT